MCDWRNKKESGMENEIGNGGTVNDGGVLRGSNSRERSG